MSETLWTFMGAVLSHSPLGVALVILGIEWMTQKHYLESVRDDEDLDPQFKICCVTTGWRKHNTPSWTH